MGHDGEPGVDPADAYAVLSGKGTCTETLETLYWYLDGELTVERRVAIRHHLETCDPCLEAFDFEVELKAVIASRCRDQVPDALRARVAAALAEAHGLAAGTVRRTPVDRPASGRGGGAEH